MMTTTLTLSALQRVGLVCLLSQQAGTLRQILLLAKILEKVHFTPEERERIKWETSITEAGASARWDASAVAAGVVPAKPVELDGEEAAQLTVIVKSWNRFTIHDHEWLAGLVEQLPRVEVPPHVH